MQCKQTNPNIPFEWSDLTLANVNSVVLAKLAPELNRSLKPNGTLITSGILMNRLKEVADSFSNNGFQIIEQFQDDDWISLVSKKS